MTASPANRAVQSAGVVLVALLVVGSVAVPAIAAGSGSATATDTSVSVEPGSTSVALGNTTTVDIVVDDAPDGINAYEFNISLSNGTVADITGVTLQGDPLFPDKSYGPDNDSVTASAGETDFSSSSPTVVTVELTGIEGGSTDIDVTANRVTDENSNDYTVTSTQSAALTVTAPSSTVTILGVDSPGTVDKGQTATVEADIKNTGAADGTQDVDLLLGGTLQDTKSVSLSSGERKTVSFDVDTSSRSAGTYDFTVETADDSESGTFTVQSADGAVDVTTAPASTTTGVAESTTFTISTDAPRGLQGATMTLDLSNATVGNITDASLSGGPAISSVDISDDNSSVSMDSGFLDPRSSASSLDVATVTVESAVAGTTDLDISSISISDSDNEPYEIASKTGASLTVRASAPPTTNVSVTPATQTTSVGGSTTVGVVANASEGVQGWSLTLGLEDDSVANITGATLANNPDISDVEVSDDNSSVEIEAGFLSPRPATDEFSLTNISLDGTAVGESNITIESVAVADSDNEQYEIASTSNGSLTVESAGTTTNVSVTPASTTASVGTTTTVDVVANASEGIQGWSMTLGLDNDSVANITDATLADNPDLGSVEVSTDNSSVELEAGFLSPRAATDQFTLATVTLTGAAVGETNLTIERVAVNDGENEPYSVSSTADGKVVVSQGSTAPTVPGGVGPATDTDGDGQLEDVDGDGRANIFDAITYYNAQDSAAIVDNPALFDFDGDGTAGTIFDAIALYNDITSSTDDTDETDNTDDTDSTDETGTVSNELTGFEVVEHSTSYDGEEFSATLRLRNTGQENPSLIEHDYTFVLYDDSGTELGEVSSWQSTSGDPAPGEEAVLDFTPSSFRDIDYNAVASYEVVLTCGTFDEGVYCPV